MITQGRGEPTQRLPRLSASPRPLVIVVDDNHEIAETVSTAIGYLGFRVEVVFAGDIAVPAIVELEPAYALIDICMPGMTGWDVARTVRARAPNACTKLISITGLCDPVIGVRSRVAGFEAHLVKPFALAELRRVMTQ